MDGRIGRLNCRCKVLGAPQNAGALQARLERLVREQLAGEYNAALESALGDDPSVYVLRSVRSRLALVLDSATPDQAVAQRWGAGVAQATVRSILREPEGEDRVRFEDQADYVTHFIVDLLHGDAWEHWFYGAFHAVRSMPLDEALINVLEENREQLPAILGCLHRSGALEPLLTDLGAEGRRWLWVQARGDPQVDRAAAGSLLRATMDLFDQLSLWRGSAPDPDVVLDALSPLAIDWRDAQGLADGMLELARALRRGGYLRLHETGDGLEARLHEALAPLDWLDTDHLGNGLLALLRPADHITFDLPLRPVLPTGVRFLTPHQYRLLEALRNLVHEGHVPLDTNGQGTERNALRLYAALVAADESWKGDGLALDMIQRLLAGWQWLRQNDTQGEVLGQLSRGEPLLPGADTSELVFLARLAQPGAEVLKAMMHYGRHEPAAGEVEVVESGSAGVVLLFRALYDAHITAISKTGGYDEKPGLDGLILSLCLAWAGSSEDRQEGIDPGLRLLAGAVGGSEDIAPLRTIDDLYERWNGSMSPGKWQALYLHMLAGQRLLLPDAIFLYRMERNAETMLVAGDASGSLWPFVEPLPGENESTDQVLDWLDTWQQATGVRPQILADAGVLDVAGKMDGRDILLPADAGPLAEIYQAGRDKLLVTLDALAGPPVGQASWNLSITLAASSLLRLWARWLRGFGESSVPYLLDQFIHRAGTLSIYADRLVVEMDPRPLDIVLELSGYLSPLRLPWMGDRLIQYQIRGRE